MGRLIEWKSLFRKTKKKEQTETAPKEMFYDISKAVKTGGRSAGYHWRVVE